MTKQMSREDILTPVHKGIRSMIYELGTKLQKIDFTDVSATESIIMQLRHDLQSANSTCLVCLLHEHAGREEQSLFPLIAPYESNVIDIMIQEHIEITRQLVQISRISDDLLKLNDNEQRIELGVKLNMMANNLFAFYLTHMNKEEATLLPIMWKYLTDDQLRAIREKIEMATPPERYAEWMRWVMSSLNVNELIDMFSSMKMAAPPQVLSKNMHLAEENVNGDTWNIAKSRLNL